MTRSRHRLAALAALVSALLAAPPAAAQNAAQDAIGAVTRVRGAALATQAGVSRPLAAGGAIFVADEITTRADTRLEMRLTDGTVVTLGDDTVIAVAAFAFDPASGSGNALLRVSAGVFRAVTGRLSKLSGNRFAVATPVATAGIRGTDFWGEQRADLLRLALLDAGPIVVTNDAGSVELAAPNLLTVVTARDVPPSAPVMLSPAQLAAAVATISF